MTDISIIGLGKLGACMLVTFASKGFKVTGVEIDKKKADLLKNGKTWHYEPQLEEYLNKYSDNITITDNFDEAIKNSSVTFVVVNTPSEKNGAFSTKQLILACKSIGSALKQKNDYHLVVITSTVMPQTIRNELLPEIESSSSKKIGKDFGLCYNPEFIALGSVIHDFLNPDFILIGESDKNAGDLLSAIFEKLLESPKLRRMSLENAEVTKIALNSYITMKITFANLLAELCEKIPNGNVDIITESIGLDRRIGKNYLKGALSFGGPCFPRDNRAFSLAAKIQGCNLELPDIVDKINYSHINHITDLVLQHHKGGKISILGVTYKPNTDVIEASASIEIAKRLVNKGAKVTLHDPVALDNVKKEYDNMFIYETNIEKCIRDSDVCVLATPWEQYKNLKENDFKQMTGNTIIDCWRFLDSSSFNSINLILVGMGKPTNF